jgi:6-phosphogluconolactonase
MFAIDPSGSYLFVANQGSDNVVVFRIHQETGRLTPTGQVLNLPGPVSLTFVAVQ